MISIFAVPMFTAVVVSAQVRAISVPMVTGQSAISEACLGRGSPEMEDLLAGIRRVVSRDIERADEMRTKLGLEKRSAADVVPVTSDSICARALRIIKVHLGAQASVSESVAVVSVGGKYIARYRFRAAQLPRDLTRDFYFNHEFTEVTAMTW